jgi:hypothetical protein
VKQHHSHPVLLPVLAWAVAAASAIGQGAAAQPGVPSHLEVAVHATHYVLAGRAYFDVDALSAAIDAMQPRSIGIDACGRGTTRALKVATYRLRARPLHLRALDRDDAACSEQAAALLPTGQRGRRIDDEAVDRYWESIAP